MQRASDDSGIISAINDITQKYTTLLDEVGSITYVGEALPGSLTSDPVWRIKKIDESTDPELILEWADGVSIFIKVWDNRASYSYS